MSAGSAVTKSQKLSEGDPRDIARALLPVYGFSSDQFSCLDSLYMSESGLAGRRGQPELVGVRHPAGADPAARPAGGLHDLGRVADPMGPGVHPGHLRHPVQRVELQVRPRLVLTDHVSDLAASFAGSSTNLDELTDQWSNRSELVQTPISGARAASRASHCFAHETATGWSLLPLPSWASCWAWGPSARRPQLPPTSSAPSPNLTLSASAAAGGGYAVTSSWTPLAGATSYKVALTSGGVAVAVGHPDVAAVERARST